MEIFGSFPLMSMSSLSADAFVAEVVKKRLVWGIRDKGGFPTSTNASGEVAMPFWSSEAGALAVIDAVAAYRNFEPVPIGLSEFVERWLPGLERDGLRCGLNWAGKRATGYDLTPTAVLARLTGAKSQGQA